MQRAVTALALLVLAAPAEVLDRAAVRVGNELIPASAIRRHLRMQAFFDQREPDFSPAARQAAAERLIDQILVRRELELTRYTPPPDTEIDAQLAQIAQARGQTTEALPQSLGHYGFSIDELRAELRYRLALLRFVDFRFSPGVQITDEEIQAAYQSEVLEPAQKRREAAPAFDDVRPKLERLLTLRKTNVALEQWLQQARQQVKIHYFEEALK